MIAVSPRSRCTTPIVDLASCVRIGRPLPSPWRWGWAPRRPAERRPSRAASRKRRRRYLRKSSDTPFASTLERKLLPWPERSPYAHVARLAWNALETKFPRQDNGLADMARVLALRPGDVRRRRLAAQPGGALRDAHRLGGALVRVQRRPGRGRSRAQGARPSARARDDARGLGLGERARTRAPTPATSTTRAPTTSGATSAGAATASASSSPTRWASSGFAYLQIFELTGDARYREAAIACADALAKHVREGDETRVAVALPRLRADQRRARGVLVERRRRDHALRRARAPGARRRRRLRPCARARGLRLADARADDATTRGAATSRTSRSRPIRRRTRTSTRRCARRAGCSSTAAPTRAWRDHVAHLLAWAVARLRRRHRRPSAAPSGGRR